MQSTFIGREQQLADIDRLIKAGQGGVYAVKGNPGMGKSTLLRHIADRYKDKGQVFVDLNDLPPLQKTAIEFLQFFAERAHRLKHTQDALAKINGTYKSIADLTEPYQTVLTDAGRLAAEELSKNLDGQDKSKISSLTSILWKLGVVIWGRKRENDKAKLGDPELYLLKALKKDCKQHPLVFIDTYERLPKSVSKKSAVATAARMIISTPGMSLSVYRIGWSAFYPFYSNKAQSLLLPIVKPAIGKPKPIIWRVLKMLKF